MHAGGLPSSGDVLDHYRIEELLGEGAMGVVFRAVDRRDGRVVAVKVLRPELSTDARFVHRFEREVEIASQLRHHRLVPVLASGVVGGARYLVTQFAAERTLAEQLASRTLSVSELVQLAAHVGEALDALAARDLVHRDVSPRNLLLGPAGARLTDFGLARGSAHTVLTRSGRVVGNVAYLAPELVEGQAATPASDIYALGCVLFEAAVGRPPFTGRLFEVVHAHVEREPPNAATARAGLPRGLGDAIGAALAKDPRARPRRGSVLTRLVRIGAAEPDQGAASVQV